MNRSHIVGPHAETRRHEYCRPAMPPFGATPQPTDTFTDDFYGDEDDLGQEWDRANLLCAAVFIPLLVIFGVPAIVVAGWREAPVLLVLVILAAAWVAGVRFFGRGRS